MITSYKHKLDRYKDQTRFLLGSLVVYATLSTMLTLVGWFTSVALWSLIGMTMSFIGLLVALIVLLPHITYDKKTFLWYPYSQRTRA